MQHAHLSSFLPNISPTNGASAEDVRAEEEDDEEALAAFYANEYGEGQTALLTPGAGGARLALLPPEEALRRALEQSAAEAQRVRNAAGVSMPRSRALFLAAAEEALAQRWVESAALAAADWESLLHVATLALCRSLPLPDAQLPEVFALPSMRSPLQRLRAAWRADDSPDLGQAVCSADPTDALARSLRAEAHALCLRERATTTLLLQDVCKDRA